MSLFYNNTKTQPVYKDHIEIYIKMYEKNFDIDGNYPSKLTA